ncbi:hypothetical protein RIF29_01921 [Crotalaria pallida]|uniref:Uncharacterized protein n=1 Tax=Crotalaria pallida TaxID=3830 RepID=A0AAN9IYU2_CROPI
MILSPENVEMGSVMVTNAFDFEEAQPKMVGVEVVEKSLKRVSSLPGPKLNHQDTIPKLLKTLNDFNPSHTLSLRLTVPPAEATTTRRYGNTAFHLQINAHPSIYLSQSLFRISLPLHEPSVHTSKNLATNATSLLVELDSIVHDLGKEFISMINFFLALILGEGLFIVLVIISVIVSIVEVESKSFLIGCASNSSVNVDGRKWVGELAPNNNVTLSSPCVPVSSSTCGNSVNDPLYRTARIFKDFLNYTIKGVQENCFFRFHFCPFVADGFNVNESSFGVVANVNESISAIEIVPVMDELFDGSASKVGGGNLNLAGRSMETMYRLNISVL